MTTVELVRHTEAHRRDEWWGKPDRNRPLTEHGEAQSRLIARELVLGKPIDMLYSSPYLRCMQTLAPLASSCDLDVLVDDALAEGPEDARLGQRALAFVDRVTAAHMGQRVVACSHGDVIPALMAVLAARDGLDLDDAQLDKGAWFTLTFEGSRCVDVALSRAPQEPD